VIVAVAVAAGNGELQDGHGDKDRLHLCGSNSSERAALVAARGADPIALGVGNAVAACLTFSTAARKARQN